MKSILFCLSLFWLPAHSQESPSAQEKYSFCYVVSCQLAIQSWWAGKPVAAASVVGVRGEPTTWTYPFPHVIKRYQVADGEVEVKVLDMADMMVKSCVRGNLPSEADFDWEHLPYCGIGR